MNHYPRHIGDYLKDTVDLEMIEDGAYNRLIDRYYDKERPLPLDHKQVYKLARCKRATDRAAVDVVLAAYFERRDDGYHLKRADKEIASYQAGGSDADAKRENERERQQRARERRRKLFAQLRELGHTAPFDATTHELEEALSRFSHNDVTPHVTPPVTRDNRQTTRLPEPEPEPEPRKAKSKTKAARKRAIPPDFSISDSVRAWAEDKGYTDLAVYLEHFVGRNTASGKEYVDWDQTFMNAIREDWYGVRKGGNGHQTSGRESRIAEQERVLGSLTGYDPKRTIDRGN